MVASFLSPLALAPQVTPCNCDEACSEEEPIGTSRGWFWTLLEGTPEPPHPHGPGSTLPSTPDAANPSGARWGVWPGDGQGSGGAGGLCWMQPQGEASFISRPASLLSTLAVGSAWFAGRPAVCLVVWRIQT